LFPEIVCRHVNVPYNGIIIGDAEEYYSINSVIEFSCNDGYSTSGSVSLTCQGDGSWTGNIPLCEGKFSRTQLIFSIASKHPPPFLYVEVKILRNS